MICLLLRIALDSFIVTNTPIVLPHPSLSLLCFAESFLKPRRSAPRPPSRGSDYALEPGGAGGLLNARMGYKRALLR